MITNIKLYTVWYRILHHNDEHNIYTINVRAYHYWDAGNVAKKKLDPLVIKIVKTRITS